MCLVELDNGHISYTKICSIPCVAQQLNVCTLKMEKVKVISNGEVIIFFVFLKDSDIMLDVLSKRVDFAKTWKQGVILKFGKV